MLVEYPCTRSNGRDGQSEEYRGLRTALREYVASRHLIRRNAVQSRTSAPLRGCRDPFNDALFTIFLSSWYLVPVERPANKDQDLVPPLLTAHNC